MHAPWTPKPYIQYGVNLETRNLGTLTIIIIIMNFLFIALTCKP